MNVPEYVGNDLRRFAAPPVGNMSYFAQLGITLTGLVKPIVNFIGLSLRNFAAHFLRWAPSINTKTTQNYTNSGTHARLGYRYSNWSQQ